MSSLEGCLGIHTYNWRRREKLQNEVEINFLFNLSTRWWNSNILFLDLNDNKNDTRPLYSYISTLIFHQYCRYLFVRLNLFFCTLISSSMRYRRQQQYRYTWGDTFQNTSELKKVIFQARYTKPFSFSTTSDDSMKVLRSGRWIRNFDRFILWAELSAK